MAVLFLMGYFVIAMLIVWVIEKIIGFFIWLLK